VLAGHDFDFLFDLLDLRISLLRTHMQFRDLFRQIFHCALGPHNLHLRIDQLALLFVALHAHQPDLLVHVLQVALHVVQLFRQIFHCALGPNNFHLRIDQLALLFIALHAHQLHLLVRSLQVELHVFQLQSHDRQLGGRSHGTIPGIETASPDGLRWGALRSRGVGGPTLTQKQSAGHLRRQVGSSGKNYLTARKEIPLCKT
jgi:hypothetical protein